MGRRRASVRQELKSTVNGKLGKASGETATETKRKGLVIHGGVQTWKSEWPTEIKNKVYEMEKKKGEHNLSDW